MNDFETFALGHYMRDDWSSQGSYQDIEQDDDEYNQLLVNNDLINTQE